MTRQQIMFKEKVSSIILKHVEMRLFLWILAQFYLI